MALRDNCVPVLSARICLPPPSSSQWSCRWLSPSAHSGTLSAQLSFCPPGFCQDSRHPLPRAGKRQGPECHGTVPSRSPLSYLKRSSCYGAQDRSMGLFSFSLLRKGYTTTPSLKKVIAYLTRTTPSPVFNAWQFRSQANNGWQHGAAQDSPAVFPAPPPMCKGRPPSCLPWVLTQCHIHP